MSIHSGHKPYISFPLCGIWCTPSCQDRRKLLKLSPSTSHSGSCRLLRTTSRPKCVAQIAKLSNTFQFHIGLNITTSFSKTDWKRPFSPSKHLLQWKSVLLFQLSWNATTSLVNPPETLRIGFACYSLPANTAWILYRILTLKPAPPTLHDFCLTSIHSASIPFFHFLNFSINNSSDSANKTRSSA